MQERVRRQRSVIGRIEWDRPVVPRERDANAIVRNESRRRGARPLGFIFDDVDTKIGREERRDVASASDAEE